MLAVGDRVEVVEDEPFVEDWEVGLIGTVESTAGPFINVRFDAGASKYHSSDVLYPYTEVELKVIN